MGFNQTFCLCLIITVFTTSLGFWFEDCGSPDAKVRFENVSFSPDPVIFGDVVHVQAAMKFLEGISRGFDQLEVSRIVNVLGYPIIVPLGCPLGGCRTDLCWSLSNGMMCEWFRGTGNTCGCPSSAKLVKSQDFPVHVPPISALFSFVIDGLYRLRWTLYDYEMKEIGCVTADINFAGPTMNEANVSRANFGIRH